MKWVSSGKIGKNYLPWLTFLALKARCFARRWVCSFSKYGGPVTHRAGLGKTVEAIALILLNRHPLSTKRDDTRLLEELEMAEASAKADAVDIPARATTARGTGGSAARIVDKLKQSTIDLSTDLDLSHSKVMSDWWKREKDAFKSATVHDPVADLNVNQVAVSRFHT